MGTQHGLFSGQEVRLTVLGSDSSAATVRLKNVDSRLAIISCIDKLAAGTLIRIDAGDALLLGECRRCAADGAQYEAEIILQQIVPSLSDLARLMTAVASASEATPGNSLTQRASDRSKVASRG